MTFAGYFQAGTFGIAAVTMGGIPAGKTEYIPRNKVIYVITDAPEGTTKQMVEEKLPRKNPDSIKLEFNAESQCPDDVQAEIKGPGFDVTVIPWSRLCEG